MCELKCELMRGWFGKLPSAGDFLSHGLPLETSVRLDHWLSTNLLWLDENQSDWASLYVEAPACGFVIKDAVRHTNGGSSSAVGVLMPSVDSVGRLFPFILLQTLAVSSEVLDEGSSGQNSKSLNATLHSMWLNCAQALENDWPISRLKVGLDEGSMTSLKGPDLGAWNEPELTNGPHSWFVLQPEAHQSLSIRRIDNLTGWPHSETFLQLLRSMENGQV